jgi:hypothetical protein
VTVLGLAWRRFLGTAVSGEGALQMAAVAGMRALETEEARRIERATARAVAAAAALAKVCTISMTAARTPFYRPTTSSVISGTCHAQTIHDKIVARVKIVMVRFHPPFRVVPFFNNIFSLSLLLHMAFWLVHVGPTKLNNKIIVYTYHEQC